MNDNAGQINTMNWWLTLSNGGVQPREDDERSDNLEKESSEGLGMSYRHERIHWPPKEQGIA